MNAPLMMLGDNGVGHMDGWGGGWMWLWGALMMLGIVLAIVWLVRGGIGGRSPQIDSGTERARAILAERYARGELTTEEYRERVDHLA